MIGEDFFNLEQTTYKSSHQQYLKTAKRWKILQLCLHFMLIIDYMHSKRNENKNEVTYISAVDFERYLAQLALPQAQQLRNFMESNPLVESSNKGSQRFYRGSPSVLNEIEYLIGQSRHKMIQTSYQSYASSVQSKLFLERTPNLTISDGTFDEITNKISTLKRIERCPLEMTILGKEQREISSKQQIYITTRCWGIKRIYFIFDKFHELIQLQALLDMEWRLDTIDTIRKKFQEENIHLLRNSYNGYDLYFFQRTDSGSWEKFISIINKNDDSYLMLTKFCFFKEIYSKRKLFKVRIKIVFSDDVSLQDYKVAQLKVFPPQVQFKNVRDLALSVLRNNQQGYTLDGELLDCMTSFNYVWMQQKGNKEMLIVRPDQNSSKEYVYFTFYSKLMEIVRQEGEQDQLALVQRSLKEQFPNSIYRNSLEDVLKQAAVNQYPFFYFCQLPREVTKVDISSCKKATNNDANRLLYYLYLLQQKHYKASAPNIKDVDWIAQRLESPFLFKFQCQQIVHKMGKTKSAEIIKKYREGDKGCILASASFSRSFILKWVQANPLK